MSRLRSVIQALVDDPGVQSAVREIARGHAAPDLCGLTQPAKALVSALLAHDPALAGRPVILLVSDNETAERMRRTAATLFNWLEPGSASSVSVLPAWDCSPYEARSPHAEISERRAVALWNLAIGRTRLLIAPVPAALARYRNRADYATLALQLKKGEEVAIDELVEHLARIGYEAGEPVEEIGQFSVRGGIVDIFSPEAARPIRVEFFDDRVESLREFDPSTQRSQGARESALLLPMSEVNRSPDFFETLISKLAARVPERVSAGPGAGAAAGREPDWATAYASAFPGWEFYAPLVNPHPGTLFSLVGNPVLVWDEPAERREQAKHALEILSAAYDELRDVVPSRPRPEELWLDAGELEAATASLPQIGLRELAMERSEAASPPAITIISQPVPRLGQGLSGLAESLRKWLRDRSKVLFTSPTGGQLERLREILAECEIPHATVEDGSTSGSLPEPGGAVLLVRGELEEGVIFPGLALVLLSEQDVFGRPAWAGRGRRRRSGVSSFLSSLGDLKVGDYVVHVDHGIGLYQGLRQLEVDGTPRDFMFLTYQEDAKLYVPLERLDLVEKYRAGGEGAKPQLDRLGGATWQRTKTRVKRALHDMAQDLLRLYAERKMRGGVGASTDTPWQKEFEDSFEFEETPDQLTTLAEIKKDLERPEPMDRLLCGDVGYGKTEVAMRAAFKVVQDSRQAALLSPTTVLAFQHLETFRRRMAPFPVRVEMLSRFRSPQEQKKILAETEAGKVDILIGTHRLLSKDVRFHDLGLLIIDDEHRFGVSAKEKIKKLKAGVDVISLSATPIPRTLHMSLGGLRDLSVIETPPRGRLAIQTMVAPFSESLIQSAILQEMGREGQVYFIHNRIESIFTMASLIQRLVPTARLGVAHGQMNERELEKVMLEFIEGRFDVLVATALIENGLDIPRANSILVDRAERFGLADLYQLRGRVGRSDRRAYAYFLVPAEEVLTPTAKHRLAALKEFSELGAGFRLAALDLELRGAGNLLGREQHGHLNAVGIDLYLKMLEQTVDELQGAPSKPDVRTTLNLGLDIRIPPAYIADESQRLRMYKRISALAEAPARAQLENELIDRYGPLPSSVGNLLDYALLKSAAEAILVQAIERRAGEVSLRFHERAPVDPRKLTQFVRRHSAASFRPDGLLRFQLEQQPGDLIEQIHNVLRELQAAH